MRHGNLIDKIWLKVRLSITSPRPSTTLSKPISHLLNYVLRIFVLLAYSSVTSFFPQLLDTSRFDVNFDHMPILNPTMGKCFWMKCDRHDAVCLYTLVFLDSRTRSHNFAKSSLSHHRDVSRCWLWLLHVNLPQKSAIIVLRDFIYFQVPVETSLSWRHHECWHWLLSRDWSPLTSMFDYVDFLTLISLIILSQKLLNFFIISPRARRSASTVLFSSIRFSWIIFPRRSTKWISMWLLHGTVYSTLQSS